MRLTRSSALRYSKGFSLLEVMVALAILGVAIVAIFQLFSISLRSTKNAENYTSAIFYARSMLDEAYSVTDPVELATLVEFEGGFNGRREVNLMSSSEDDKVKLYQIIVTVTWPPTGSFELKGLRTIYETEQ